MSAAGPPQGARPPGGAARSVAQGEHTNTLDLLVRLYDLPDLQPHRERMLAEGVELRRPNSWEKRTLLDWVGATFSASWALEVEAAFAARPPTCFVAIRERTLVGFAVYDCTRLDFFGPTGVAPDARGRGIGVALLLTTLHAMRDAGYAYAIIGGVGPAEFYARAAGAIPIPGSTPGVYDFALVRRDAPDGS